MVQVRAVLPSAIKQGRNQGDGAPQQGRNREGRGSPDPRRSPPNREQINISKGSTFAQETCGSHCAWNQVRTAPAWGRVRSTGSKAIVGPVRLQTRNQVRAASGLNRWG